MFDWTLWILLLLFTFLFVAAGIERFIKSRRAGKTEYFFPALALLFGYVGIDLLIKNFPIK